MASDSGFLGAALAVALAVHASPARSDTIDLSCATDAGHNMRIVVDTNARTVAQIGEGGRTPYDVTVMSEQFIKFGTKRPYDQISQQMTIDRVAGTLSLEQTYQERPHGSLRFVCRRATQKF